MIQFFKMVRISCDRCETSNFEVFTFKRSVDPPEGWKSVTYYWTDGEQTQLCCPDCTSKADKNDLVKVAESIVLRHKDDGKRAY